jgi:hypothetical protein
MFEKEGFRIIASLGESNVLIQKLVGIEKSKSESCSSGWGRLMRM